MIGSTLSKYRVLEKLGEGGMGAVYLAEDTRLGRQVALKLLPAATVSDREARARMLEEARAVARLEHPNICTLFEFDEANGTPFIAMQYVDGGSLRQALAEGPLPEERVRAIVAAIAAALEAAHARGIVHRDVKCDNILLAKDGRILLADFGIAFAERDTRLTAPDVAVGTPYAMAPEQVDGRTASPASDQFALGVVAYECLTGRPPFRGDTLPALIHAILTRTPEPPTAVRPGLRAGWDAAVVRALAKDPVDRHASVRAFAEAAAATASAPRPQPAKTGGGAPRSLAVLYFDNLSSDAESDYFCAGITEDLLTDLSKVQGLGVASRNAVGRYRGQSVDIPHIAAELGVEAVLEGSVRKSGNRVRINAQLIDASTGLHLWADRYDRTLDDVFAVQDDITSSIAKALRGTLTEREAKRMTASRPGDVRAYDIYLKGRRYYASYTEGDMKRALECFEQASHIDPSYALAWAGIADCCGQMIDKGWSRDGAWIERGEAAGRRAVELDDSLPEAHKALALNLHLAGHKQQAEGHLERVLTSHPSFVPAIGNLGSYRFESGNIAGAERCFRRAIECDPMDVYSSALLSFILISTGRAGEALDPVDRMERWATGSLFKVLSFQQRVVALLELGDPSAAHRALDRMQADGLMPIACGLLRMLVRMGEGERIALPALTAENEVFPARDLHVLIGARAGDPEYTFRALERVERLEPYSFLVAPGWVRSSKVLRGVQLSAPIQRWLDGRGRALVWPAEAEPLAEDLRAQFTELRVESGIPTPGAPL